MSSDVLSQQVVAAGQIRDAITGGIPRGIPRISIVHDSDNRPLDNVHTSVTPGAIYAVHGDPTKVLPPAAIDIRIDIEAPGYSTTSLPISFTAAELARQNRLIDVDGEVEMVVVIGRLPRLNDVALPPLPVILKGRIGRAEAPDVPIAGAIARIIAPTAGAPTFSDANGFFTLGPAPVASVISIQVQATNRTTLTTDFTLNFADPVNQISILLEPI